MVTQYCTSFNFVSLISAAYNMLWCAVDCWRIYICMHDPVITFLVPMLLASDDLYAHNAVTKVA